MTVDLERIVGGAVKEESKSGRDDNGLECDDARGLVLGVERPTRSPRLHISVFSYMSADLRNIFIILMDSTEEA